MTNKIIDVVNFLGELFPNAKCELVFNKDYELVIAVMLSAQTTDKSVNKVTSVLFSKYDTLEKIANADIKDIESIIKSIGLFKVKAKNVLSISKYILENGGVVPNDAAFLLKMPGVGIKTKNVVLAELYGEPLLAVDTHVQRVAKRLKIANSQDTPIEIESKLEKLIDKDLRVVMHHRLIHFGRYFCTAKKPRCTECKLAKYCNQK